VSLATRCTSCGTVFRVAQDQLKASEGWVRCGRCSEVFNALEGLFDLEGSSGPMPLARDGAGAATAGVPPPSELPLAAPASRPSPLASEEAASELPTSTLIDTQADTRTPSQFESSYSAAAAGQVEMDDFELIDSQVPDEALAADAADPAEAPGFLRHAERAARWQRPRVRRALWTLAALMVLLLATQATVQLRDALAARWPAAAPMLSALCGVVGCTLEAPRTLSALAVDSSGLTRLDAAPLYRLQVAVRNRGTWPVAMPALDLTLTDLRGEVVARRVLRATDLVPGAPEQVVAGGDWSAVAVLDLGERRVAGYTIELFYP
jgi:predicted Zn finger-like uncharacterized protein